jgi:hypothetical protein
MPEVTYGRLDKMLRDLGFSSRTSEERARVYRHEATEALIVLPLLPMDAIASPHHLATVRATLDDYGFADTLDLASRLPAAS